MVMSAMRQNLFCLTLGGCLAAGGWNPRTFAADQPQWGEAWSRNMISHERGLPDAFDPKTGERTEVLTGFASFPNGLVAGPDGALYTSNWGISYASGDGSILRIVP